MKKKFTTLSLALLLCIGAILPEVVVADEECPMYIRAVLSEEKNLAFHHFDKKSAEEIAIFTNGDMMVVRFNAECGLGFDAALFKKHAFKTAEGRRQAAARLIRLFRGGSKHNSRIEKRLESIAAFENPEFRITVDGFRMDEQHLLRLVDIQISPDVDSAMFDSAMLYSWLPPSGE